MRVRRLLDQGVALVDPEGIMDVRTMVEVRGAIGDLIREGTRHVLVNCEGVGQVTFIGLGVLVERLQELRALGGSLSLLAPSPDFREVMRMVRVEGLFPTFRNEAEALEHIGARVGAQTA